jgi:peptidyl-prolyl cis-trans isomerase SurA
MIKHFFSAGIFMLLSCIALTAQKNDPILFSVEGVPVRVSEFDYIYSKTNGDKANYSKASLEEYLDLYVKFKLKVHKAKELKIDTIQELQQELDGYRRQLADSYLINKEVTEELTKEAYSRKQQDVDISHIFFQLPNNPTPEDTLKAFQEAVQVKALLDKGGAFAELAKKHSDDRSAQSNGGHVGFVTALFPSGFYNFETATYESPLNQVSKPIRTSGGYHLVKVHSRRPARGEVETAHILLRTERKVKADVRKEIDAIYEQLQAGGSFESLAQEKSEDARTAPKGGYIGYVAINRFQEVFEDAAFALNEDNTYSQPFESDLGFHIVKRISKKSLGSYEAEAAAIEAQVKKDERFEASKVALLASIKQNAGFQEFPLVLDRFIQTQNDTFFTFRWKAPQKGLDQVLFVLGKEKVDIADFASFLKNATRERLQLNGRSTLNAGIRSLYQKFVDDQTMRYEENQLEEKYPDFKALMREYEEGILLFEVTKRNVWDKAAQDTTGLKRFFKTIQDKYQWNTRAVVEQINVPQKAQPMVNKIQNYAKEHSAQEVVNEYKLAEVTTETMTIEKDKDNSITARNIKSWKEGYVSMPTMNRETGLFSFVKIKEIIPPSPKELKEARGYIIADYQDFLEKQWVDQLRKEYEVKIQQKVFNSLIK